MAGTEPPADRNYRDAGVMGCPDISGGVTDHYGLFPGYAGAVHYILNYCGIRLEREFGTVAQYSSEIYSREKRADKPFCSNLDLVGGHRKLISLIIKVRDKFRDSRVRSGVNVYMLGVVIEEAVQGFLGEGIIVGLVLREGAHDELAHAVAHHQTVLVHSVLRQPESGQCMVRGCAQVCNRIEQRTIQIEYHQSLHAVIVYRCFAFIKKKRRFCVSSFCGATGNRTRDTRIFSPLLYQLSYDTKDICFKCGCKDTHFFKSGKFLGTKKCISSKKALPLQRLNDKDRNVAQLVAHYVRDVGVGRSSRLIPTEGDNRAKSVVASSFASL